MIPKLHHRGMMVVVSSAQRYPAKANNLLNALTNSYRFRYSSAQTAKDKYVYIADGYDLIGQIIFIITVYSSMFTNQLGLCNNLTALEIIGESFGVTDPGKSSWTISGYRKLIASRLIPS